MNVLAEVEERINARIDGGVAGSLAISDAAGGVTFASLGQVMEFAKMMAVSGVAIPKHLRANVGTCLAVCIQAIEWRMSPFAVANKSYSVSDRLSYEAQLVHAVILQRAPIIGRVKVEYSGEGASRRCRVWASLSDGSDEVVDYESPLFSAIKPKNSPLWTTDPDQQLFYYSVRAWCRRHFPDVLLGVYARDELDLASASPAAPPARPTLDAKLNALAAPPPKDDAVEVEEAEVTVEPAEAAPSDVNDEPGEAAIDDLAIADDMKRSLLLAKTISDLRLVWTDPSFLANVERFPADLANQTRACYGQRLKELTAPNRQPEPPAA